jgi:hypothetical protein
MLVDNNCLPVGIGAILVQTLVTGSYCSTAELPPDPPIAYILPSTTLVDNQDLPVGIGALSFQASLVVVVGSVPLSLSQLINVTESNKVKIVNKFFIATSLMSEIEK